MNYIEVDLNEVREFIEDPDFSYFLLEHTTNFNVAAFILQTLLDATKPVDETQEQVDKD